MVGDPEEFSEGVHRGLQFLSEEYNDFIVEEGLTIEQATMALIAAASYLVREFSRDPLDSTAPFLQRIVSMVEQAEMDQLRGKPH